MIMRWLACGGGHIHILGTCPDCYATQGGLLIGTVATTHKGRVTALCVDCGKAVDYYVDAKDEKMWKLEPIEARGVSRVEDKPMPVGELVLR